MTKFSNVLKAGGLMMGLVWGMYGNTDVNTTRAVPKKQVVRKVPKSLETETAQPTEVTDYPTVKLRRVVIDLTDAPSQTRSVSAPLKSDDGDLP